MKKRLTPLAINLRKNQTLHESKLWSYLRRRNFVNCKFRRQFPIGRYIVDFCCPEKKIIIEVDGGQHNEEENLKLDKERDRYLKNRGFKILRIWNNEITQNPAGVGAAINHILNQQPPPLPVPPPRWGEGTKAISSPERYKKAQ